MEEPSFGGPVSVQTEEPSFRGPSANGKVFMPYFVIYYFDSI